MPLVNMTINQLVAHHSQDAFTKNQFFGYVGMLRKNKGFAEIWRAQHPEEIAVFEEYENMFKSFRGQLGSNVSAVGKPISLSIQPPT